MYQNGGQTCREPILKVSWCRHSRLEYYHSIRKRISIYEDATPRSASILIDIFRTYSLNKTRSVCGRLLQYSSCLLGAIKATSTSRKSSQMPTKTVLLTVHPRHPGKELAFNKRRQNGQLNSCLSVCV